MNKRELSLVNIRYLSILVFVLILNCKSELNTSHQTNQEVIFKTDALAGEWIKFSYYDGVNFKNKFVEIDTSETTALDVSKLNTRFVTINLKGMSEDVFLTTEDTVLININKSGDENSLSFSGKNAAHYNYFGNLIQFYQNSPSYLDNINNYQLKCNQYFETRKNYIDDYCKTNNCSIDFKKWILNELFSEHYSHLISPIVQEKVTLNEVPSDYFDKIDIYAFENLDLSSRKSTYAFSTYIKNYFTEPSLKFSKKEINDQLDFINKYIKGAHREFALTDIYISNHVNLLPSNIEMLKAKMMTSKKKMTQKLYIDKITEIENEFKKINNKLPDSILNVKVTSLDNKTYQINDLINENKGTVLVFDVWASWCVPCLHDIEVSKEYRSRLNDEGKVKWVFLSFEREKGRSKWIAKSKEKEAFGLLENQYLIHDIDIPRFSAFSNIDSSGIPKYLIFDKEGELILLDAPHPSDSLFFERAIKDLY